MAGVCVGPGLFGGPDGIELYGPRSQTWNPVGAGCGIDQANGLRVDPVTQKLWAPPDAQTLSVRATANPNNATPTFQHDTTMSKLAVSFTGFQCRNTFVVVHLTGGTCHLRLASGNYWAITSAPVAKINGVVTALGFGPAYWVPFQHATGNGVITAGLTTPSFTQAYALAPGDKLDVSVVFVLTVLGFAANAYNLNSWQPPQLLATGWSKPL